jgi:TonB family protein
MSAAEGTPTASPMLDPDLRVSRDPGSSLGRLGRAAIIAALLFHAGVIGAIFVKWPFSSVVPPPPPPIAVTLVKEPPAAPAPTPAPQAKPTPPPPPPAQERVSGADNETTAPPKAADKAPEAAPPPPTLPPQDTPPTKTAIPVPKDVPNPAKEPRPPKPKVAEREAAPTVNRGSVNRAPGEREQEGDPYLNRIWAMIEQHRTYPANAKGSLGLPLEGTSVYLIEISSDGALLGMELERSAGAAVLDQAAARMIQSAAPFPPPPPRSYPGAAVVFEATIHLFPGAS